MPDNLLLHPTEANEAPIPVPPTEAAPQPAAGATTGPPVEPNPQAKSPEVKAPDEEKPVDYGRYKIGGKLDGVIIHHIFLQYFDAIVFTSKDGSIYFRVNTAANADAALKEFYRLDSKSRARLKRAYTREVNALLGAALAEALSGPPEEMRRPFEGVDQFIDEQGPITVVFGATPQWVIFIDKSGELVCDYRELPDSHALLMTEFHRLRQLAWSSLPPEEVTPLLHILGTELMIALQRTTTPDAADAFSASRDYIQLRNELSMTVTYLLSSIGAAIAGCLLAWQNIDPTDKGLLLGCIGGIMGATISVLQRSANLEIRRFLPVQQVAVQGVVRMMLGFLFGILIVAAVRVGVALEALASSANGLFLAGVVAGFSERFVPDLLEKVASDEKAKK